MTFDMQRARSEKRVTEIYDHLYPAALDEIERLQDREQQLLLDVNRNHREKTGYAEIVRSQAKRIAELEADNQKRRRNLRWRRFAKGR